MIVRYGNAAPVFIKHHDASCIPECPARHEVVTGYEPAMPSFAGVLSDAQIDSLILYIKSLR